MKIFILLLLFSSLSQAKKMTVVKDHCESIQWEKQRCDFVDKLHDQIKYNTVNKKASMLIDIGGILGTLTEQMENINNPSNYCVGDQSNLGHLRSYARKLTQGKQLSSCQKACVVKCITANYLTWTETKNPGPATGSPCQVANSGKGECWAFASLADDLNDHLGLKSQSVANVGHAYNKIKFGNKWYYSEPQDSSCRFGNR